MLVGFTIENFRSIYDKTNFSMQTAPYLKRFTETNTFQTKPINVLKNAVVFGPNGSGKTNLIEALNVFETMILNSFRVNVSKSQKLPYQPFKMHDEIKDYTFFEIILLLKGKLYSYGLKYNDTLVLNETLKILHEDYDSLIFSREYNEEQNNYVYEFAPDTPDLKDKTRKTILYLSVLSEFNNDFDDFEGKAVYNWFLDDLVILDTESTVGNSASLLRKLENKNTKSKVLDFLKIADFNIVDIELRRRREEIPEQFKPLFASLKAESNQDLDDFIETTDVYTVYNKYDSDNEIIGKSSIHADSFESRGTNKMILIAIVMADASINHKTVFIDEFDNAFHNQISKFLIKIFNNENYNQKSQFIITTHDISLLDTNLLRVDQIWFADKSKYNKTDFYSLYDFNATTKKVRSDVSIIKDYISGKFGAVPIINDSIFEYNIFEKGNNNGISN